MANEPNSPVVLRTVKHDPVEAPKAPPQTGILFECPTQTKCPHCKAVVPLADVKPLSSLPCPACGGKVFASARVGGFLLYAHIGEGEMGAIYRATDESLFRDVAIKLVRGCHADDRESRERLRREACAAGKLNHPRVAQVYALNFSNGHPYLVMELVTGEDFAQKLEREGRIDERTVLRMALDVADGLSALNREGLVHGDIKPANIVLDRDGNAKLVDFGLSGMTRRDRSGNFVGTPNYIAPELLRFAADNHRSDLYSLGATLYHLLAGRPPFDGETPAEVLKARLSHPPAPLGKVAHQVSLPTQRLVMRMLEANPQKRHPNSEAVAADIRSALSRLDFATPETPGAADLIRRLLARIGWAGNRGPLISPSQKRALITGLLSVVAVINLVVAIQEKSFQQTFAWVGQGVASWRESAEPPAGALVPAAQPEAQPVAAPEAKPEAKPEAGEAAPKSESYVKVVTPAGPKSSPKVFKPAPRVATPAPTPPRPASKPSAENVAADRKAPGADTALSWQSMNLGGDATSGSTMQLGGTLIVQGTGANLWEGVDSGRFVWAQATGNYTFSAQVKAIADNNSLAVSGLLLKGEDPGQGPGLLFGFLGSGELFLQIRQPTNQTSLVKRSGAPVPLPLFLRLARSGTAFEASVSADGRAWQPFAGCALDLPSGNAVGFCVSSQDPAALAAAKFASVLLVEPDPSGGLLTNKVPAGARKPAPATRK